MELYFLSIFTNEYIFLVTLFAILMILIVLLKERYFSSDDINQLSFYSLFQYNPDAAFLLNREGKILCINQAAEELFSYSLKEIMGSSFSNILEEKERKIFYSQLNDALLGESTEYQIHSYNNNGRKLYLRLKTIPYVKNKKTQGVFVVIQDLTENELIQTYLHEANERLTSFLANTVDAISITNLSGEVLYINRSFEMMFLWTQEELLGRPLPIIPSSLLEKEKEHQQSLRNDMPINCWEDKFLRKDGTLVDVNVSISPLKDKDGLIQGFTAITRDETMRKEAERKLRDSEEKYRIIADNSSDLIRIIDKNGLVKYASPSHTSLLGYEPEDLIGSQFYINIHPDEADEIKASFLDMTINPKKTVLTYRFRHKFGNYIDIEAVCSPFFYDESNLSHYIVVSRDISERKQYEEKLKQQAFYDSLTEVGNRRLFNKHISDKVENAKENNQKFALLYLDCDRFKWINDTMGHDVGDEFLKRFVLRIQGELRSTDSIYRLGGDEFAVILNDIHSKKDILIIADRITQSIQTPWSIGEQNFNTTCSIGISVYPFDGEEKHTLVSHADKALYFAKDSGRNLYKFYTDELE